MNPLKKLASQTAIYGLPTIVGRLLNYFLVPLYTYQFLPPEYGVVTEMYAYVSFLMILLTYGMETSLFRFSNTEEDKELVYSTSLISLLVTSVLFIFISFVFSHRLANLLDYSNHREYIIWFALILSIDAFSAIPFARLREQHKAKRFALLKSVNIFVNIILNVLFVGFCKPIVESGSGDLYPIASKLYNPEIGIGYIFISNLIASAVTLILLLPEIIKVKYRFDKLLWKRMMPYTLPLMIAGLAGMTNETIDRILIKYLLPENIRMEQLGIYGACYKVSIIMTIFIQTFRYAAEPFFFSHAKNDNAKKMYSDVMKYFVVSCAIIFLGTMMNMQWIQFFVGEEYREGLKVVPILLISNLFLGVFYNLSIWYKLTGQTHFGAYLAIMGAVVTLGLNFYLIPKIGYLGSAWAAFVCHALMMVVSYFIGQHYYRIDYNMRRIFIYSITAVALYYIIEMCLPQTFTVTDLIVRNLILFLFILFVFIFERKNFSHAS